MTKAKIYEQYDKATNTFGAYVIAYKGQQFGRAVFTYGASGCVTCYLHIFGSEMTKGRATGGGYDKQAAAFCAAAESINLPALNDVNAHHVAVAIQCTCEKVGDSGFSSIESELARYGRRYPINLFCGA